MPENPKGILYLVATPIGNLADLSFRAVAVLQGVDFIACEDTRHSRPLLERHGIIKPLAALHEHNEDTASKKLLDRLEKGESMALISDAGTPLINDPGFPLVRLAIELNKIIKARYFGLNIIQMIKHNGFQRHRLTRRTKFRFAMM